MGQSLVSEGAALQRTGLIGQRFDSLDRLAQAAQVLGADPEGRKRLPEIRNHAIAALGLTDLRVRRQHDCGDVFGVSVDAALERYAVVESSGAVVVRRLDDDRELVRLPGPDQRDFWYAWPAFSPDGELLVAGYAQGGGGELLRVWHLGRRELLGSLPSWGGLAFHPDGRRLLFGAPEGGIGVWDRRRAPGGPAAAAGLHAELTWRSIPRAGDSPSTTPTRRRRGSRSSSSKPAACWPTGGRRSATVLWPGAPMDNCWPSAAMGATPASTSGTSAAGRWPRCFRGTPPTSSAPSSRTRVTCWRPRAGTARPGSGTRPRGSPWRRRRAGCWASRRMTAGWPSLWVGRSASGTWPSAAECRTLHPAMLGNRSEARDATGVSAADVSPDGRLVATGDGDGVRLWEADTGRELAHLKAGVCETVLFHPDGQSLISSSRWGLYRWPIRPDPERGPDAIRVGPPELLQGNRGRRVEQSDLAARSSDPGADRQRQRPGLARRFEPSPPGLEPGNGPRQRRESPHDLGRRQPGRPLAGGRRLERGRGPGLGPAPAPARAHLETEGCCRRHEVLHRLQPRRPLAGFEHAPRCGHEFYHFWRVGTWEPGLRIDQERNGTAWHRPAFTGDGRLMALGIAPDQVLLADAATGRELARLTTLQPVTPTPLVFSPDGTKLVASTNQKTVLVWDLRQIRDQLAPMGLDWDAPPYPTVPAASDAAGPLPPPRPVRVVGEVIEPQARRAAELAEMNRRLAAKPDDAEALIHRGWLFTQQKKWPEAIADLERGLHLRPDDTDALFLLAEAYSQTNNLPAARATLEKYLARCPDDIDARVMKGQVALQLGRLQEAVDDFSKVLDADPESRSPVRYRRAQIWLRLGKFQEALADLDALIQRYPSDPALYELRSQVHDRLGHREQAQADMKQAAESPQAGAEHYNNLAWRLATGPAALRDPEQALVLARKAVALTPGTAIYLNTLGVAQYRAGQYAEAIATLEKSLAASKGESDAFDLFFLAMARHKLGQIDRAQGRLRPRPPLAARASQPRRTRVVRRAQHVPGRGRGPTERRPPAAAGRPVCTGSTRPGALNGRRSSGIIGGDFWAGSPQELLPGGRVRR